MAGGLTWIKFKKTGQLKEVSTRIANNKDYQNDPDRGFTIVGAPQESNPEPQKKIEVKSPVAEVNNDKEITAQVETQSLQEVTQPVLTNEQKVLQLHKEGKSEEEIKAATGMNKLTIRKLIKNA